MPFVHQPKTRQQLKAGYDKRVKAGRNGFIDFADYCAWYQAQDLICRYCGLTEVESQEIVMKGILTSNRFPHNGVVGRGQARGVWLEVDRIESNGLYSRDNCVLACYFCNNDKSDVFTAKDYEEFCQNRPAFLRRLLNERRELN